MKTKLLILMILVFLGLTGSILAQEKYAILISGDRPDVEYTPWWQGPLYNIQWGSWNDTYLMWEMLVYEKGYRNENVFVLWADGIDWWKDPLYPGAPRYNPHAMHGDDFPNPGDQITDYSATVQNVNAIFQNLTTGQNGLPQITADDFLFVWVYGRTSDPNL
jgi:hypothetical protein